MKYIIGCSLLVMSLNCISQDAYMCDIDGKKVFSQLPCSNNATKIALTDTDANHQAERIRMEKLYEKQLRNAKIAKQTMTY